MSKQVGLFLEMCVAIITGDDAKAKAVKIQKKALAILRAQIAVKTAHTLTEEEDVENATEALAKARMNNGSPITDNKSYVQQLMRANEQLTFVTNSLDAHIKSIEFLQGEYNLIAK